MPTINLSARVRFWLYIIGALASLGVVYAVDKSWAGDAETRLVQGIVALLGILAAANTNTAKPEDQAREVGRAVGEELNRAAVRGNRSSRMTLPGRDTPSA